MKKLVLILGLATLFSCEKEIIAKETKNCDCDKIVLLKRDQINIPYQGSVFVSYITTVNECTGLQLNHTYRSEYSHLNKKIGECY